MTYAISIVSQFTQAPYKEHMEVGNHIRRYLKTISSKGLICRDNVWRLITTLIGQDRLLTESPLLDTVPLCGVILLLGGVKS